MTWTKPLSLWLAPAFVLALGLAVLAGEGRIANPLPDLLFDAYQRHLPPQDAAAPRVEPIDMAAMDEESLAHLVQRLTAAGVKIVALAAPPEPEPSPTRLSARLPPGLDAARAALAKLPEPGHDLAVALHDSSGIVPVTLDLAGRRPVIKARFAWRGVNNPFALVPRFLTGSASPAILENNAAGSATAWLPRDNDGVLRRMPVAVHLGTALVPGLATEIARIADGTAAITVTTDERNPLTFFSGVGIAGLEAAGRILPVGRDGSLRPRFAPPQERRLNPDTLGGERLDGVIAVIGPAGAMVQTPLGPDTVAGALAQGARAILSGAVLGRPGWMLPLECALLALLGMGLLLALRLRLAWAVLALAAELLLLFLLSWYVFAAHGLLLDAATIGLVLLLVLAAGALAVLHDLRLAHDGLRAAFADSLPRAAIDKIARKPALLNLEGENRTVTYLVCGVRGLPALAANYRDDPASFTALMQKILTPLMDQALQFGGTIDRLTADGFAAFWNAPLDDAEHALHACEAASGMTVMTARVNEDLAQQRKDGAPLPVLGIGVGIATGPAIAGAFGGHGRMGYSVQGEMAARAQRIQALSSLYGPAVVVDEETRNAAERAFAFLEVDSIAARHGAVPIALFAIMGNPVVRNSPKFRALGVFHDHIFQAIRKQQWDRARELIAQCRRLSGASQTIYDLHLKRITWYEQHPPGSDWDGAFRVPLE